MSFNPVSEPSIIRNGVFGTSFTQNGEQLYLRMEQITEENTAGWTQFKRMSSWLANADGRGILSSLVLFAGKKGYPSFSEIKDTTHFTEQEFDAFTQRAIQVKEKTHNTVVKLIQASSHGSYHLSTGPDNKNYIVYVLKNQNFSIHNVDHPQEYSLKNYINSYQDILIAVGSNFSDRGKFYNRGIFRNPHWIFEQKYSGLSMLLHGFTGAVASKFFPEKEQMIVRPIGSMQMLIQKHLRKGEGYAVNEQDQTMIDIVDLIVSWDDPEDLSIYNQIQISALTRIYQETIASLH